MKAVMLSIKPKWCELIASGKKTVEVRKTKPKIEVPFKCYIYCALPPKEERFTHGRIRDYANELIRLPNGKIVYDYGMRLACEDGEYSRDNFLCKKVIGEFMCDAIISHCESSNADIAELYGCIKREQLFGYSKGEELYGYHISDLVIYDKPKDISEFKKYYRKCYYGDLGLAIPKCSDCKDCNLKRPPQSWYYVEEMNCED